MKLTFLCYLNNVKSENKNTITNLIKELSPIKADLQLIVATPDAKYDETAPIFDASPLSGIIEYFDIATENIPDFYNQVKDIIKGDYVTAVFGGDTFWANTLKKVHQVIATSQKEIYLVPKEFPNLTLGAFRVPFLDDPNNVFPKRKADIYKKYPALIEYDLEKDYRCYPLSMGGTFIKSEFFKNYKHRTDIPWDYERDFFLHLMTEHKNVTFINQKTFYVPWEYEEQSISFYHGLYELSWYYDSFEDFWKPLFAEFTSIGKPVPKFIQYNAMYSLLARINGNLNNRNKHVIEEGKGEEYLRYLGEMLKLIDDDIIFNKAKVYDCSTTGGIFWIYGILKHGENFKLETLKDPDTGKLVCGAFNVPIADFDKYSVDIQFMEYENGRLEIDGKIHTILFSVSEDFKLNLNGVDYALDYCERYAITKVFGKSIYKGHCFHVSIPIDENKKNEFYFDALKNGKREKCKISFESHFSRLSKAFNNSYWCFGENDKLMAVYSDNVIIINPVNGWNRFCKEVKLQFNMLSRCSMWIEKYALFRILYFFLKPFMTRKPIWMYIDKIYKGGDSSEYLYQYASKVDPGIKHYYLIDKYSSDYKRLKALGFKPLKRNSILQKLVFLYADMMIISNSTVYAFNGYGLKSSDLIRGLPHFHVCCVQHGMSVQKIAVAQHRIRDNTRLYFCASKYELDNLTRPVYDYNGYDALKLTGVPRYDGLHDRSNKQIMISPTWRMQAAVPVRTNEGEQRDYNPLFKESTYYKVFNSLINDPRLIKAAAEYDYRIKYVLHPIVSSQVDDFDKNDYVDIVPAVGDMSYEDMFCESSLMVTDFSGIQFDFAYMRKPVVYLHHRDIPQHYEEGTFFYDTMAFGEICHDNDELIDLLIDYMKNGCEMKDEYKRRADDFFYYDDDHNCERIYQVMKEYQLKKMGK